VKYHQSVAFQRNKWIEQNINKTFFKSFLELEAFRETGLGNLVPLLK